MPIEGFNNINSSGVLITNGGVTQLRLEPDGQSLHVGQAITGSTYIASLNQWEKSSLAADWVLWACLAL